MNAGYWAAQAEIMLAVFHRIAMGMAFIAFLGLVIRKWGQLSTLSGPVGHVMSGTLAVAAIPEALFPLFWIIVVNRPVTDISHAYLAIYVYIGAALTILMSVIGLREAFK